MPNVPLSGIYKTTKEINKTESSSAGKIGAKHMIKRGRRSRKLQISSSSSKSVLPSESEDDDMGHRK
jgi:hypothetical protein